MKENAKVLAKLACQLAGLAVVFFLIVGADALVNLIL